MPLNTWNKVLIVVVLFVKLLITSYSYDLSLLVKFEN